MKTSCSPCRYCSFAKLTESCFGAASGFTSGLVRNPGQLCQFERDALKQIAVCSAHCCDILHYSGAGREPAVNRHRAGRCLLAVDTERTKFSRRDLDVFLSRHLILLMDFQVAGLPVEIPPGAPLKRHGDHRLRRIKFNQFAIQINPRPTKNSAFVHGKKVSVCDHAGTVHFEFEKLLPVNVFGSLNAIHDRGANFAVRVWSDIGNTESVIYFLRHVVSPGRPGCGWDERSGNRCGRRHADDQYEDDLHSVVLRLVF